MIFMRATPLRCSILDELARVVSFFVVVARVLSRALLRLFCVSFESVLFPHKRRPARFLKFGYTDRPFIKYQGNPNILAVDYTHINLIANTEAP